MNKEDIEAEAYRRFPIDSTDFEMLQRSDVMWDGFVEGAEWMQEQCHKDFLEASAEIEMQHVQDIKQKQTEVDELHNKVSELTEALDASHVFCEGVSDLMAERAWGWFCTNLDKFKKEIRLEDAIKLYSQYKQAMKGGKR